MHVATETFTTKVNNVPVVIAKGEFVDDDHELVARFPQWFRQSEPRFGGGVEQATRAPGEKRPSRRTASDD